MLSLARLRCTGELTVVWVRNEDPQQSLAPDRASAPDIAWGQSDRRRDRAAEVVEVSRFESPRQLMAASASFPASGRLERQ